MFVTTMILAVIVGPQWGRGQIYMVIYIEKYFKIFFPKPN